MEFKIKKHSITDNGFEIYKVNGHVPQDLMGYFSDEIYANQAIEAYMLKVVDKKEKLEKEVAEEKAKIEATKKATVKKPTTKKATKK